MLVANSLDQRKRLNKDLDLDLRKLFGNDMRGPQASFGIQNIAEVGLTEFGVFPGEWYGINQMSQVMEQLIIRF